jgi:hypothetical protein
MTSVTDGTTMGRCRDAGAIEHLVSHMEERYYVPIAGRQRAA